ncbi:MAG: hypothetical protein WBI17_14895 [Clostridiaceae bacterium]
MIYIINGPSGTGKTIVGEYLKTKGIRELISHTTRNPRTGEVDGVAYHFVSEEVFGHIDKVEESVYAGNRYGVSKNEVIEKIHGGDVFAVTDINGTKAFKKAFGDQVKVIYVGSTPRFLRKRMVQRGDSKESIRRRIETYRNSKEMKNTRFADFIVENNSSIRKLHWKIDLILKRKGKSLKKKHCLKI